MMPVNLSIKNVPDDLVATLKATAIANHRSLNGQVIEMLKAQAAAAHRKLTIAELADRSHALGIRSSSSVEIVRAMRDER